MALLTLLFPDLMSGQETAAFELSAEASKAPVWGRGMDVPRKHFREFLPALFERTLVFDSPLPAGSTMEWIFTGDVGGVTVRIETSRVVVVQRYYDSFGLAEPGKPPERYAQRAAPAMEIPLEGPPQSVSVAMDHKFGLHVQVNGNAGKRQRTLLDVRRHQLAWTPAAGDRTSVLKARMIAPAAVTATVAIDPSDRRQTIHGFGGITSRPAYEQFSPRGAEQWWRLLREYNLLIHREYPNGNRLKADLSNFDDPAVAVPHYYGDNFPNGEVSDFDYIRRIRGIGGEVLFEFWNLPPWARTGTAAEPEPIVSEYVRAMVGYCKILEQRTGAPPEVLGIQNEPRRPSERWPEMVAALRKALDEAGYRAVRLHMPDHSNLRGGTGVAEALRRSPATWAAISYAATHVYDFQEYFEDPDGYDARIAEWKKLIGSKPFFSTELTVNHSGYQTGSYRVAFAMAQLFHKNLALMEAVMLNYCWTVVDVEQASFAATRALFAVDRANGFVPVPSSYMLRAFGAFSRRLPKGMVRVGVRVSHPDVLATAYEGDNGRRTAVLLNRSTVPVAVRLTAPAAWLASGWRTLEIANSYRANEAAAVPAETLVLQPGDIATLTNVALLTESAR